MSVLFQSYFHSSKSYLFNKSLRTSLCKCLAGRKFSDISKKFTFDEIVAQRRAEAKRSIVIQVNSESSFNELYGYCSKYGDINGIHHYRNDGGEHFMLVEFVSEDCLNSVIQNCASHQKDNEIVVSKSPFLWFRAATGHKQKLRAPLNVSLVTKDGNAPTDLNALYEELLKCGSISDQIQMLYDKTKLNDLGTRLRYMVARQLEVLFESLFSNVAVRPFGSSVNGFGKMGCDLDLVLTNTEADDNVSGRGRRLVWQAGGRRPLELAADAVGGAAGASRVARVLHARVPIVKFGHDLAALDCDLCYGNLSGVRMSSLLWALGSGPAGPVGPGSGRVRPLVGAVRAWARAAGLTSAAPGRWITNFPLTLLTLFFLQQPTAGRLLPPLDHILEKDKEKLEGENHTCVYDINKLADYDSGKAANLEKLLLQFFEFYAQFDFQNKAINVNEGIAVRKPSSLPMYIINPLDKYHNVSRNVSYEECQKFQTEVRNAAWQLEASMDTKKNTLNWGLLNIIERVSSKELRNLIRAGNSHRLVSVKDLFSDETDHDVTQSKSQPTKSIEAIENSVKEMKETMSKQCTEIKKDTIKFKNRQIASEVYRIRRDKPL